MEGSRPVATAGGDIGDRPGLAMNLDVFAVTGEEVDSNPGPVVRSRANTWHGRPKVINRDENSAGAAGPDGDVGHEGEAGADGLVSAVETTGTGAWRKGTTRRNAWGNLSYADLITKAIESSPEKRMTLSQIYGWMVQNIAFFKDKGESNSSAGWKNSIRHNLSLHNRFMRVQNEGTGKSSWWMINPDAKAVKVPRRRAATMDTKSYSGKRTRVQRAVSLSTATSSSDLLAKSDEYGESMMDSTAFSAEDYRNTPNPGVIGMAGMSRMQAVEESEDVDENEVVSSSSSSWNRTYAANENFDETLSESLADIFVGKLNKDNLHDPELQNRPVTSLAQERTTLYPNTSTQCTFVTRNCPLTYPAPSSQCHSFTTCDNNFQCKSVTLGNAPASVGPMPIISSSCTVTLGKTMDFGQQPDGTVRFGSPIRSSMAADSDNTLHLSQGSIYGNPTNEMLQRKAIEELLTPRSVSDNFYSQVIAGTTAEVQPAGGLILSPNLCNRPLLSPRLLPTANAGLKQLNSQMLLQFLASKPQLMAKVQQLIQSRQHTLQQQQQFPDSGAQTLSIQQQQQNPSVLNHTTGSMLQQLLISSSTTTEATGVDLLHSDQIQSTLEMPVSVTSTPSASACIPADLDLNYLDADAADIDCDIDQVIKHELTFGESLDFSFDHSNDS